MACFHESSTNGRIDPRPTADVCYAAPCTTETISTSVNRTPRCSHCVIPRQLSQGVIHHKTTRPDFFRGQELFIIPIGPGTSGQAVPGMTVCPTPVMHRRFAKPGILHNLFM
jgi:hypothetical protein